VKGVTYQLVFLLMALWAASSVLAQEVYWRALNDRFEELYHQGRDEEALEVAQEALRVAETTYGPDHLHVAYTLERIARLHRAQQRYTAAEPLYQRALTILEAAHGRYHLEVALALDDLAGLYQAQGRDAEAESLYQRALTIRELGIVRSLANLAGVYRSQRNFAAAEPLYRRALAIMETAYGPEHPELAFPLTDLAELYKAQKNYGAGEPLYQRALEIRERALGPDHPQVEWSLTSLAGFYQAQRRYGEAAPLYQRALAIVERHFGADRPEVVRPLIHLAALYRDQRKYALAETLYQRAVTIVETTLGPQHFDLVRPLIDLAGVFRTQGKYVLAEPLYQRALNLREATLGSGHPEVAWGYEALAGVYQNLGRNAEAESAYRRALRIMETARGAESPEAGTILRGLAELSRAQGNYAAAAELSQRALAIHEAAFGPHHPEVAYSLQAVARLLQAWGDYATAEIHWKRGLAIIEAALGPTHPDMALFLSGLAEVSSLQGDQATATLLIERSFALWESNVREGMPELESLLTGMLTLLRAGSDDDTVEAVLRKFAAKAEEILGPDHPSVASWLNRLAEFYRMRGKYADAEPLFRRALQLTEQQLGENHPEVASVLNNWALLYKVQGHYDVAEPLYRRAIAIAETALSPDHPRVADFLSNLASLEIVQNRPEAALALLRRALQIDERTLNNVFSLASERKKFAFLRSVDYRFELLLNLVVQRLRTNPEAVRTAMDAVLRWKGVILDALIRERRASWTSDDPAVADIASQLQQTSSRLASLMWGGPGPLSIDEYRRQLAGLEADRERLEEELARRSQIYATAQRPRQIDTARVAASLEPETALVEYVVVQSANLGAKGIEPLWGSYRYIAFVLHAGEDARPVVIDLGEAEAVDGSVRAWRRHMAQAPDLIAQMGEAAAERRLRKAAERLYTQVFAPLKPMLDTHRVLSLSLDGGLSLIPFEAIVDDRGQYLIETHQFAYLASGRDILGFGSERPQGVGVVILGNPEYNRPPETLPATIDRSNGPIMTSPANQTPASPLPRLWMPLPGTQQEAIMLAKAFAGEPVYLYLGTEAREDVIKRFQSPRILHLATHGFFLGYQEDRPWRHREEDARNEQIEPSPPDGLPEVTTFANPLLRSGIVLAGANALARGSLPPHGDDGILTALEIAELSLQNTDLVVLSACETGVGEISQGEGVFGLRRAFQLAGARTVMMSLWAIPDGETVAMIGEVYRRLQAGVEKGRALREAALTQLRTGRQARGVAHPFFWGAFVTFGHAG
jgi:CHAT domain-containing protein/Tfp pilus assembly protein PilF